jgi:tRNA uridine 5-carboxymethylaminomethyl modification enzyme
VNMTRSTWNLPDPHYDLIVVGAGHAGIEAALAGSRLGMRTLLITMSLQTIGQMSCNPAIGGIGKGQLVREIDALGGEMGRCADRAGIQFRMLNRSRGPAVWSPRAQSDKALYANLMVQTICAEDRLDLRQGLVSDLSVDEGRVCAVVMDNGTSIRCGALILAAGTFLNGMTHVGNFRRASGRAGEPPALGMSQALADLGIEVRRYKTGTPPRVDRRSINFSAFETQAGDQHPVPFRYYENLISQPQCPCYITWTNASTHQLLRDNITLSPMYAGKIEGTGPRYCPSVEDKVVRFSDKDRHQLFLEPESPDSREMYVNGFSTSMPEEVQLLSLRTVPGFEDVRLIRPGYAIEYDYFPTWQLDTNLALRGISNLFLAGQINGTSGYEEAAAQGLLAAINAAALLTGTDPLILGRDQAYAGVLIDDLVNKPLPEPYRMFTSRAEFRLLLRQDNADERLMPIAHRLGLLEDWRWQEFQRRQTNKARLAEWLRLTTVDADDIRRVLNLEGKESPTNTPLVAQPDPEGEPPLHGKHRAHDWLRRPEIGLSCLLSAGRLSWLSDLDDALLQSVELDVKYAGYIERQLRAVENFRRNENAPLPEDLDYASCASLSIEARDRLVKVRPKSLGQASRVGGVDPTDIQALWVYIERRRLNRPLPSQE